MAVGVGKRNGPDLTREERKEEEGELELEIKARRIAAEVGCCKSDVVTRELSMTKVSERVVRCFFFFFFPLVFPSFRPFSPHLSGGRWNVERD